MENGFISFIKEKATVLIVMLVLLVGVGVIYVLSKPNPNDPRFVLAQCLTEKGVKMYGAFWCPHCQATKRAFGSSFEKVTYVECGVPGNTSAQTQVCQDANIESYPTWEFADGSRTTGAVGENESFTFADLAEKAECEWSGN